ncbi:MULTISPECIES: hypothetical protein [unclassified Corynebacterium]|uniref:hypothetical protein n=1 Tax=unclassified Corynebacterium TaxID=2624378 RepID=UPI00264DA4FA|nr:MULTISPECIES: hypothetical protein [unclassified Corynebacterium]MDN8593996.1 hypothetical protein [Corynebacterium sp. P4_F2]WKK54887.1 hypothetical protein QYR03_06525 [Corynebacterium sp. P4-C1]
MSTPNNDMLDAVRLLRDAVDGTRLDGEASGDARSIVNQLDDYVLPRLANLDAPLLAVIGGSTGSGKSTLVNAVLRERGVQPGSDPPDDATAGAGGQPGGRGLVQLPAGAARPGPFARSRRRAVHHVAHRGHR